LDGYRRQYINDRNNNILERIQNERKALEEVERKECDRIIEEQMNNVKNKATIGRCQEAADDLKKNVDRYNDDPSEYNKNQMDKSLQKVHEALDEITKMGFSEYLVTLYNNYNDYLDTLNPDKIVCLFNIIVDGLILSSF